MVSLAVQRFECTNCGQTDPLTLAAVALSRFSLFVAIASFGMQRREHRSFLRRLNAEPELKFVSRTFPDSGDDGVIRLPSRSNRVRLDLGRENVGVAPATDVLLNLLLPRTVPFWWCDSHGVHEVQPRDPNQNGTETLNDGKRDVPIHWRDRRVDRLGRHRHYAFYAQLGVGLPPEGSVLRVPFQFKVTSHDLPGGSTHRPPNDRVSARGAPWGAPLVLRPAEAAISG